MKKSNKKQMRLSEADLEVVLKMRNEPKRNYRFSVDSQSTYRLILSREEEDAVAKARVARMMHNARYLVDNVYRSLAYIYEDYEIEVTMKNKVTGNVTYVMVNK